MTLIDLLTIVGLSAIPAAFNYFLDYVLGHPMSDSPSTGAIGFRYSLWLAKLAMPLKKEWEITAHFAPMLNDDTNPSTRKQGKQQLNQTLMIEGKKYFTFEQAIGMCPFCTNFWCSIIAAVIFAITVPLHVFGPVAFFICTPIFSHTILRKL